MPVDLPTDATSLPELKTLKSTRPDPEYARAMGVAADLRADVSLAQLIRKWRISESQVEWVRQEMSLGRYGGSTGRPVTAPRARAQGNSGLAFK